MAPGPEQVGPSEEKEGEVVKGLREKAAGIIYQGYQEAWVEKNGKKLPLSFDGLLLNEEYVHPVFAEPFDSKQIDPSKRVVLGGEGFGNYYLGRLVGQGGPEGFSVDWHSVSGVSGDYKLGFFAKTCILAPHDGGGRLTVPREGRHITDVAVLSSMPWIREKVTINSINETLVEMGFTNYVETFYLLEGLKAAAGIKDDPVTDQVPAVDL